MVIAARRDEGGFVAQTLLQLEAEDARVEGERALDVGHLEVDVADVYTGIDRSHPATIPAPAKELRPFARKRPEHEREPVHADDVGLDPEHEHCNERGPEPRRPA